MGFDVADLHVYTVVQQLMGFLEHPIRLTYTGNHADVDLELATTGFLYEVEEVLYALFSVHTFIFRRGLRGLHEFFTVCSY